MKTWRWLAWMVPILIFIMALEVLLEEYCGVPERYTCRLGGALGASMCWVLLSCSKVDDQCRH